MEVGSPLATISHLLNSAMACLHAMLEVGGVRAAVVYLVVEELKHSLEALFSTFPRVKGGLAFGGPLHDSG